MTRRRFKFGEVFPADDPLAEWVATLALAFNDLALVRVQMGKDERPAHRWLYWFRLGIAHFAEAATYLRDTAKIPEVSGFVDSLPAQVGEHHGRCLECYRTHEKAIERIRNEAGFHYPNLNVQPGQRRKRTMQLVLETLREDFGEVVGQTLGDARLLFADDVAAVLVGRALTERLAPSDLQDLNVLGQVSNGIEEGIASFVHLVNGVLERYFSLAIERGAELRTVVEPSS